MWVEASDGNFYEDLIVWGWGWFLHTETNTLYRDNNQCKLGVKKLCSRLNLRLIMTQGTGKYCFPPNWEERSPVFYYAVAPRGPININDCQILPTLKVIDCREGGEYCWNFMVARSRLESFIKTNDSVVINNLLKIMEPELSVWSDRDTRIKKWIPKFKKILKKQEGALVKLCRSNKTR